MRDEIRAILLPLVGNRVYQPFVPTKDTLKPYIVIRFSVESKDSMIYAYRKSVQIWPYVQRGDFNALDILIVQIIEALKEPINGTIPLSYEGTIGQEYFDPDWQALTQGLEFSYATIHEWR